MSSRKGREKRQRKKQKSKDIDKIRIESIKLYPALRNEKDGAIYGYIDSKGNFVIKPKYQIAYDFNGSGIGIVQENKLMGGINTKGEYVIKPIYDSINPYKEGRAIYVLNGTMGVIDEVGNIITKKSYSFISDYTGGRAIIGVSNQDGSYTYGYIDREGNEIIPPKLLEANEFNDDVALVKVKDDVYGLINKEGKLLNTYNYGYVSQYGDGVMVFANSFNGPFGYINREGKVVIKPIYKVATGFKDGVAIVSTEEVYNFKYGVINLEGKYVFTPIYSKIEHLGEGRLALGMPIGDDKNIGTSIYAIGDTTGKRLSDFKYLVVGEYEKGLSYGSDSNYTFFIDKNGNIDKSLPIVKGSGELRFVNDIIRANIDFSPYYLTRSGKVIYKPNDTIVLSPKYSATRLKYKPNINYLIYYPEVKGVTDKKTEKDINLRLKEMSYFKPYTEENTKSPETINPDDVLNYNYYGDFSVEFFKKNLLVLNLIGYYYPFGAAHGMPSKKTPSIDLVTGKFYSLGDLFMGGVYWVGELNKIIENMIKTDPQYNDLFDNAFKGITLDQSFYIDENNLYIYFPPYELAPYAAGFVTFKIPFVDIQGMINKEGSFYKSFNI
ncbi:WG repeat-containing protein [Clostridium cylindrosporum]|uniref:DUF3298 domain-containing protein n=1 Tax=Clostridium cylindrosporum DSM 605 TaxID=1121307 RepID=A0A0J8G352_CLOCY|nr:WG repeat-containing protein [Clostridium cylindrosporum]KMT22131.1 hypothetical protein CLCY_4c01040 [Clostridium cylindrosporum DSM 605]